MKTIENILVRYFRYLEEKGPEFNALLGFLFTIAIGAFDVYAPDEATHSFLYIIPISFVTWFSGIRYGFLILLACMTLWSINNVVSSLYITTWNILSTLIFFSSIVALLNKTRKLWENETNLSRTDPLTGAKNLRAFSELVEYEMQRSRRDNLPFSLAYLDLDNFKQINDSFGHSAGDELLKSLVSNIVGNLRKTDVIGRLGGDEFAIFFPDTGQSSVRVVMNKVSRELARMMESNSTPATISTGVVTCVSGIYTIDELISYADNLMYDVKRAGKDSTRFSIYPTDPTATPDEFN